jgi:hypothetical protein
MRLSPEQVKQGLLHSDREVRSEAAYYFARSYSPDPSVLPLAIQAIEQFGWEQAFESYTFLEDLVQTNATLLWMIGKLEAPDSPANEEQESFVSVCRRVLRHVDPELLLKHAAAIKERITLDQLTREVIDERTRLFRTPPDQLWEEFNKLCLSLDDATEILDSDIDHANRVVEALSRHRDRFGDQVLAILKGDFEDLDNWREIYAVELAGTMQLTAAIPLIVRKLHIPDDWLLEEGPRALAKIGTPELVVQQLREQYADGDVDFRTAAASILENLHCDESVTACLELLEEETEPFGQALLLQAALTQFSTEAIEPARQYIRSTPPDPDVLEVRSLLIKACRLLDVRFPEFDEWVADSEQDRAFRKQWYADHYGADNVDEMDAILDEWEREDEDDSPFEDEPDDDDAFSESTTFLRSRPHIGRNEPCPCGSGKKYKKCCYLKDTGGETDLAHAAAIGAIPYQERPKFPIGTVALYGPDDQTTTKIVASVIKRDGAEPILKRFVGTRIAESPKVKRQIQEFFNEHRVKSVAAMENNLGCPHEEGEDFPVGEDCPFCPFWAGKQGSG